MLTLTFIDIFLSITLNNLFAVLQKGSSPGYLKTSDEFVVYGGNCLFFQKQN